MAHLLGYSVKDGNVKEFLEKLEGVPSEDVISLWLAYRQKKVSRGDWVKLWLGFFPETSLTEKVIAEKCRTGLREFITNHREKFVTLLESSGLGLDEILGRLKELVGAVRYEFYKGQVAVQEDGTPFEVPDNAVRARVLEKLIELHRIGEKKDGISNQIMIMINAAPIDKPGDAGK